MSHDTVDPQLLRRLWEEGRFGEGVALLDGVDLDAEVAPIFLHYAGLCLAGVGQERLAIDLLKRAASGGYNRFYSAYHLAHCELRSGNPAHAAYYFTVSLISDPAREDVLPSLENLVGDLYLSPLRAAQAGTASPAAAGEAFATGVAMEEGGQATAAVYYFTAALALDPEHSEARDRLLRLAPDISLEVLTGIDMGWRAAESGDRPSEPAQRVPAQRKTAQREMARVDAQFLRQLWEGGKFAEGAALLDGIDLNADLAPDFLHYAGLCLAGVGQEHTAIDLLKRAAAGGYSRFYSAYHLAHCEMRSGNTAHAAYYFTVSLISDPARADVLPSLENLAPGLDLAPLRAAQAGTASADMAREVFAIGLERQGAGKSEAAVYYFTTALALDPEHSEARARLLQLAPDISIEMLTQTDLAALAAGLRSSLVEPVVDPADLERRLSMVEYYHGQLRHERSIIAPIESLFRSALAIPGVGLDPLCRLYDIIYFLYWQTSSDTEDMRRFGDRVVKPFAASIRNGIGDAELPPVARRRLGREPLRLGYLSESANRGPGNAVGPVIHHLLGGLSRHFPDKYRLVLYAWRGDDDDFLKSLEGSDIIIRRFEAETTSERIAAVANAIAADKIDILLTDVNAALPTVLFERRVAPVQIFCQFGLPFWPLANIDGIFRVDGYDPGIDGFDPAKCFTMGLGPWDMAALAPAADRTQLAAERARFPQDKRLIGTYGRLTKITPGFLAVVGDILARLPQVTVILGGTGDGGRIRDFVAANGLSGRLIVVDRFVDGHLWGHMLDVFLDTSPQEGGVACREMMAKTRPVVSLRSSWTEHDRVAMLIADDPKSYVEIVSRLIEDPGFCEAASVATRDFVASGTREQGYAVAIDHAVSTVISRVRKESRLGAIGGKFVDLDRLVYASVFDELRRSSPSRIAKVDLGPNSKPVEVASVDRIIYFPRAFLQVWRDRIVPHEANPDRGALAHLQDHLRVSGAARLAAGAADRLPEITEDVCILANFFSYTFFHFFEELYKVVILEKFGFRGKYVLSNARSDYFPSFPTEFLELLGIGSERIIYCSVPTVFCSAYLTTRMTPEDMLVYPDVFFALREALTAAEPTKGPGRGSRLWIERRGTRVLVNAQQVHEVLDRYGFTAVDMAELSAGEQIAAAKHAEVFGGPHGAGLIHSMFLKERSAVIECFSPDYLNPCLLEICRNLRHRYYQIVQVNTPWQLYPHGINVEIDCNHLELILQGLD